MKIIENFIPVSLQRELDEMVNDNKFPWFYHDNISAYPFSNDQQNDTPMYDVSSVFLPYGLTHIVYGDGEKLSSVFDKVYSVLSFLEFKENIEVDKVLRIRIRRTIAQAGHDESKYNLPHCDMVIEEPFKTLVYYVDDSDGDTIMFDHCHKRSSNASTNTHLNIIHRNRPVKGNGIMFDGHRYHAGNNPIKYKKRTIINFDFTIKNDQNYNF